MATGIDQLRVLSALSDSRSTLTVGCTSPGRNTPAPDPPSLASGHITI